MTKRAIKKLVAALVATPLFFFGGTAIADTDHFEIEYRAVKLAQCTVTMRYYDGELNKFSCTAHDKGNHDTHKSVRLECPSGQRIRHTSDPDSEIYLSSDCDDDVSRVRAVRAQGKGKSGKGAVKFRSRHSSAKDYLQKYEHGCYQYITLRGGQEMRIMLGDSYSKANCKGITTK